MLTPGDASLSLARHLAAQVGSDDAQALVAVLDALTEGARRTLGGDLVGTYLTGSFALGAGDEASDVDFVVVSRHQLTPSDEESARRLHAALPERDEHWARHLEGSWVAERALREPVGEHDAWLYVDNGSRTMERSRHDDTWNARWLLRHAALALTGEAPAGLVPPFDPALLRQEAGDQADLRATWIREDPSALLDGWAQPYVVLTHCRLLWSAARGTVTSKEAAARWVRDEIAPERFGGLVSAAIRHRREVFDAGANRADPGLADVTAEFVAWATAEVHARLGAAPSGRAS